MNMDASIGCPKSGVAYAQQVVPPFLFLRPWQTLLINHITLFPEPGDSPMRFGVLTTAVWAY